VPHGNRARASALRDARRGQDQRHLARGFKQHRAGSQAVGGDHLVDPGPQDEPGRHRGHADQQSDDHAVALGRAAEAAAAAQGVADAWADGVGQICLARIRHRELLLFGRLGCLVFRRKNRIQVSGFVILRHD
jgi:hypothetical protein